MKGVMKKGIMMTTGKITIESGKNKAVFNISYGNDGKQNVEITFEPELKKVQKTDEEVFVANLAVHFIKFLQGEQMTEHKIIINGVDVSECVYRHGVTCKLTKYEYCDEIPCCNFKLRKRAEQKLEKIREYCNNCNLKADFTACDILKIIKD